MEKRYGWTQPCCQGCWDQQNPDRPASRLVEGDQEVCVHCGSETTSGIYVRVDPKTAAYPSLEKE